MTYVVNQIRWSVYILPCWQPDQINKDTDVASGPFKCHVAKHYFEDPLQQFSSNK